MESNDITLMFKALGESTRRKIFEFLCSRTGPVALDEDGSVHPIQGVTVGEVCCFVTGSEKFNSTIAFHLKELRLAGLITAEKHGKFSVCAVNEDALRAMQDYLQNLASMGKVECFGIDDVLISKQVVAQARS